MKIALALHRIGFGSSLMHGLGFGSIVAALALWLRSAAISNEDRKERAERLAIFVGLWPPTLIQLGKALQDLEATPAQQASAAQAASEQPGDEAGRSEAVVSGR